MNGWNCVASCSVASPPSGRMLLGTSSPRSRARPRSSLTHRASDPLEIRPGDFEQASPKRVPPTLLVHDESKLRDERRDRSLDTLREFHPSSPRVKTGLGHLVRLVIDDVADGRERL